MLVLTRKPGDAIRIGENVVVKVIDVQGGKVQLGIDAPKDVRIEAQASPTTNPGRSTPS